MKLKLFKIKHRLVSRSLGLNLPTANIVVAYWIPAVTGMTDALV